MIIIAVHIAVLLIVLLGKNKPYRVQRRFAKALTSIVVSYILLAVFTFVLMTPRYVSSEASSLMFVTSLILPPISWFLVIRYWSEE